MRLAVVVAVACSVIGLSFAQESQAIARKYTNIPAQGLGPALQFLAKDRDFQVIYISEEVNGAQTAGAVGDLTLDEALTSLLAGTGLNFKYLDERTMVVGLDVNGDKHPLPIAGANSSPLRGEEGALREGEGKGTSGPLQLSLAQGEEQKNSEGTQNTKNPDSPSKEGESAQLEEIVVTAQKREQRLQDVPSSITAIGSKEIARSGYVGMSDYLRTQPGVTQIDGGAGRNAVIIRGVSADPQNEALSVGPTVGIYFGETPITGFSIWGSSNDVKLVDMARVEVLRGPQGTLYGDSSLGGTIRTIPNAPDLQRLEIAVRTGISETDKLGGTNTRIQAAASLPLIEDRLAIRAVAYRFANSGYIRNVGASTPEFAAIARAGGFDELLVDKDNVGRDEYDGGRLAVLWKPTSRLSVGLTYLAQDLSQYGYPEVQLNLGKYEQTRLLVSPLVGGSGGQEQLSDDIRIGNAEIKYDFDWANLLVSSSRIRQEGAQFRDIGAFFGGLATPQSLGSTVTATSHEVRLTSRLTGPVQYLAGYFHQQTRAETSNVVFFVTDPPTPILDASNVGGVKQDALFGEISYSPIEPLTATAGARHFTYTRKGQDDNDGNIYRLNLAYRPNDSSLIYAQWAQGFRLGTEVLVGPPPQCDLNNDGLIDGTNVPMGQRLIDSDTLDSYELGGKFTARDRRLTFGVAVYRNEWQGIPIVIPAACGFSPTANAGQAVTEGVELEGRYLLSERLRLNFSASTIDGHLTKDAAGIGERGDRLPGSPDFNASMGLEYTYPLLNSPAFSRIDYAYVGGFYNNLQEAGAKAGDYSQLNLRTGIAFKKFSAEIFVSNALNTDGLAWVDNLFDSFDQRAFRLRPRTFGIEVTYDY